MQFTPGMQSDALQVQVDLHGVVVVEHFYFFAHIPVRHALIAMVFGELHMVVALYRQCHCLFGSKGLGWQGFK